MNLSPVEAIRVGQGGMSLHRAGFGVDPVIKTLQRPLMREPILVGEANLDRATRPFDLVLLQQTLVSEVGAFVHCKCHRNGVALSLAESPRELFRWSGLNWLRVLNQNFLQSPLVQFISLFSRRTAAEHSCSDQTHCHHDQPR